MLDQKVDAVDGDDLSVALDQAAYLYRRGVVHGLKAPGRSLGDCKAHRAHNDVLDSRRVGNAAAVPSAVSSSWPGYPLIDTSGKLETGLLPVACAARPW